MAEVRNEVGNYATGPVTTATVGDPSAKLAQAGFAILRLLSESWLPDSWVNRRVVQLEFLDTRAVRWRISVDFVVPEDAPVIAGGARLIPVTSLLKDSLAAFDLRDEGGKALSLPNSGWVSRCLSSALSYLAADVLGCALPESVERDLADVVSSDARKHAAFEAFAAAADLGDATRVYQDARAGLTEASRLLRLSCRFRDIRKRRARQRRWELAQHVLAQASPILDSARLRWNAIPPSGSRDLAQHLMGDETFRALLTEQAFNFVVLAPVTSPPGTHRIIKLSFETAISFQRPRSRVKRLCQSLGWRCWPLEVLIGGRGGSYHLEVTTPAGVDIVSIRADPLVCDQDNDHPVYVVGGTPHVHLRLPANAGRSRAQILLRVSRPGWLTVSWVTTVVIATAMVAARFRLDELYSTSTTAGSGAGTAATLLLTLLGVVASASVRPQPLAARLLLLARLLIVIDIAAVLTATGALAFHHGSRPPSTLWTVLAEITATVAMLFTLSLFLPISRPYRPQQ